MIFKSHKNKMSNEMGRNSRKIGQGFLTRSDTNRFTQTGLCSHRRMLEALNFESKLKWNFTICFAKTKALISCAVTSQLICVFVFALGKADFLMTVPVVYDY